MVWRLHFSFTLLAVPWFALTTPMLLGTIPGCTLAAVAVLYLVRWTSGSDAFALAAALVAGAGAFLLVHAYQVGSVHLAGAPAASPRSIRKRDWAAFNAKYGSASCGRLDPARPLVGSRFY